MATIRDALYDVLLKGTGALARTRVYVDSTPWARQFTENMDTMDSRLDALRVSFPQAVADARYRTRWLATADALKSEADGLIASIKEFTLVAPILGFSWEEFKASIAVAYQVAIEVARQGVEEVTASPGKVIAGLLVFGLAVGALYAMVGGDGRT